MTLSDRRGGRGVRGYGDECPQPTIRMVLTETKFVSLPPEVRFPGHGADERLPATLLLALTDHPRNGYGESSTGARDRGQSVTCSGRFGVVGSG